MIDQYAKLSKRLRERGELLDLYHSIIGGELDREAADALEFQADEPAWKQLEEAWKANGGFAVADRGLLLYWARGQIDAQAAKLEKLQSTIAEQKAEIERLQATLDDRTLQHRVQLENAQRLQAEVERLKQKSVVGWQTGKTTGELEEDIKRMHSDRVSLLAEQVACKRLLAVAQGDCDSLLERCERYEAKLAYLRAIANEALSVSPENADTEYGRHAKDDPVGMLAESYTLLKEQEEHARAELARLHAEMSSRGSAKWTLRVLSKLLGRDETIRRLQSEVEQLLANLDERTLQHRVQLENAQRLRVEVERLKAEREDETFLKQTAEQLAIGAQERETKLEAEVERLKAVMTEVGSLAGRDWLAEKGGA